MVTLKIINFSLLIMVLDSIVTKPQKDLDLKILKREFTIIKEISKSIVLKMKEQLFKLVFQKNNCQFKLKIITKAC